LVFEFEAAIMTGIPSRIAAPIEQVHPLPTELWIEADHSNLHYWQDLWHFRELFYFLAWRDLAVRYKQTAIGVAWSIIQPLLTMIIFVVVFNRIAHMSSASAPYPILVFTALLPWTFFTTGLTQAASSMVANANMVSKVYFPRLVLPTGSVIVALADFAISFVILVVLMIVLRFAPTPRIALLPVFLILAIVATLGPGLWFSALTVKYRDFRYVIPFAVQAGTYISPVGFSSSVIPGPWRLLYSVNPMVGVIDGFRWCVIGGANGLSLINMGASVLTTLVIFVTGLRYFRRTERTFADVI
jgi:lipopolysaccharide transport system permease protein